MRVKNWEQVLISPKNGDIIFSNILYVNMRERVRFYTLPVRKIKGEAGNEKE